MAERVTDLVIVVPVRDEAAALGSVLDGVARALPGVEVVVVDDGSRDESAAIARAHGARVVSLGTGRGYGAAIRAGVAATAAGRIALIDGDGTYAPTDLARLVESAPPGGMAVGARPADASPARRLGKAIAVLLAQVLTGRALPDLNSGLRVFDRRLLERLAPVLPDRFSLTTTLTLGAVALGVPLRFEPVAYGARRGRSKFRLLDALRMLRTVWRGAGWVREGAVAAPRGPGAF